MTSNACTTGRALRCLARAGAITFLCLRAAAQDVTPPAPLREGLRPIRHDTVDGRFFALMDLAAPGLETTRALVEKKQYAKALDAWRDYVVMKLRGRGIGVFNWHGNKLNGKFKKTFDVVLGRTKDSKEPEDTANICGRPGSGKRINWQDPEARFHSCYAGSRTMDAMVGYYQQKRDPAYIAKWFEIVDDFCVNQKKGEEALPLEERTGKLTYPRSRNKKGVRIQWYLRSHQITLDAAGRVHSILKGISYLSKALPDGNKPRDWNKESMHPIHTPVPRESLDMIPADALANIALSLMYDHAPFLLQAYGKVGRTPNQRFSGLTALAGMASTYDEFHAGCVLEKTSGSCLEDYVSSTVLPDGGDLEQSFNYNAGFIRESTEFLEAYPDDGTRPAWVTALASAVTKRERLFAGVTSPLGNLPRTGTYGGSATPAVWRDAKTLANWQKRIGGGGVHDPVARKIYARLSGSPQSSALPFTSMRFPYSGYYAMRDGWHVTSLYLWLMGARRGGGHHKENINGIAVTAYGRKLITDNGPPPYTEGHVDKSQKQYYRQIKHYFGEDSSLTTNTILVDMQSQRRSRVRGPRKAYQTPIVARWLSSDRYDFAESRYEDGYGGGAWGSKAPITVKHYRQVVFLRKHGLWLVTDRVKSDGKPHAYQQQWHFPPPHKQWSVQAPGFLNDQVVTDDAARAIRTVDPDGPNIALYQFSPEDLAYKRYFGSKKPWLGWYSIGIGGVRIPSVDVHTTWRTGGDSIVTTALVPSPVARELVKTSEDLSKRDGSVAGCRLVLNDTAEVTWFAARTNARLQIDDIGALAEGLLVVKGWDGSVTGIALGATSVGVAGHVVPDLPTDFEFSLTGGVLSVTGEIGYPDAPDTVGLRPARGLFVTKPLNVEVVAPGRPGAEIRYTLDGSEPDATSPLADGTIEIRATADLTIRPFRNGTPSGEAVRGRYEIRALPPAPPSPSVRLSDLEPASVKVGAFELTRNRCCYRNLPLTLDGTKYDHGIGVHAEAEVVYDLRPAFRRFVAVVGLDDVTGEKGSVVFKVIVDGKLVTQSPPLEGMSQRYWHLDCALPSGARRIHLVVDAGPGGGGWGMADWANAGFVAGVL